MEVVRFVVRRLRAQRALAVGIVVTLAFAIGAMASAPIFVDGARSAIYDSTFASASIPLRDIRISRFAKPQTWTKGDQRVRDALTDVPADAVVAQGLANARLENYAGQLILMFREGAGDHLTFTDGGAPADGEVAIPSGLEFAKGLGVGDKLPVLGPSGAIEPLTISGVFEPPPRTDDFFFGEDSPFSNPADNAPLPPVIVTRSTALDVAERLNLSTSFAWDVYFPWDRMTWQQAESLETVQQTIDTRLNGGGPTFQVPGAMHVTGGIPDLIGNVRRSVANLETPVLLVAIQILLVGLAVVAGVGVLLAGRQGFELALLHSRGFLRGWLFRVQALQAALAAIVALPLGLLFAKALAAFAGATTGKRAPGVGFPTALSSASVRLGLAAAILAAIVLALPSIAAVRRTLLDERRHASREDRALLARLPVELVVVPVGVLALIQLRQDVTTPTTGGPPVQPLLLFAPTLLILGATFLVVRLLGWTARAMDGPIGRAKRLSTYLAGRRLARSGDATFAAGLLIVLSLSLLVVATTFRATSERSHLDAAESYTGAAWAASVGQVPGAATGPLPAGVTPVATFTPRGVEHVLPSETVGLAVDPSTFAGSAWWRGDLADRSLADLLDALRTEQAGTALPQGANQLTFRMTAPAGVHDLHVQATVADADGTIRTSPSQPVTPGSATYTLDLGDASSLLSISVQAPFTDPVVDGSVFDFADVAVNGQPLSLDTWTPLTHAGATGTLEAQRDGWRYVLSSLSGAPVAGIQPAPQPLPALVSSQIDPSSVTLLISGVRVPIRPVGIFNGFPGVGPLTPSIVVPLPGLSDQLQADPEPPAMAVQAWTMGDDPTDALRAAGLSVGDVRSAAVIQAGLDQQPPALAIGMDAAAAIAGLALVVAGLAATLYVAQRRRAYEFAALLALGAPPRELRRAIGREQLWLVVAASVAGVLLGYLCVVLALPQLRASVGVRFPTPNLVLDTPVLLLAFAALALATILATRAAARASTRVPVTTVLRGEVE